MTRARKKDQRHRAREAALQILYQWDIAGGDVARAAGTFFALQWPDVDPPSDFEQQARDDFLAGYLSTVDTGLLPSGDEAIARMLSVFELEKAVYELRYELDNRPDWIGIPVSGIDRLLHAGIA